MKNSNYKKIAERYVSALFAASEKEKQLSSVEKDLVSISNLIEQQAEFNDFLSNPLLSRTEQEKIIVGILKKAKANDLTTKFMALLARHNRLSALKEIISIFLKKIAQSKGELSAELIVAKSIKDKESEKIAEKLGKVYGKKINLTVKENPELLGGSIIKIGSVQLDGSVSGKLHRLRQELKAA
ncbi:MAG: ATP synthase F1 subunit delta [Rickettsiales bacterium]